MWEPGASLIDDRLKALEIAHTAGIRTWVSVEPVIDPDQALELIEHAAPHVDTWKIGKLNHLHLLEPNLRERVEHIDWQGFVDKLVRTLRDRPGMEYLIKESLAKYWPSDVSRSTTRLERSDRGRRLPEPAHHGPRMLTLF